MKTKLYFWGSLFFFSLISSQAQIMFEKKFYLSTADGNAEAVRQTSDGGYIIAGSELLKIDSAGNLIWYNSDHYNLLSIQQTSDGGYITGGNNLVKLDILGNTTWTKSIVIRDVKQTTDGGYIIANPDFKLIKTDSLGIIQWTSVEYGTAGISSKVRKAMQTPDGGYALAGRKIFLPGYDSQILLVKTDSLGTTSWTKTFGGSNYSDEGWDAQVTSDGGFIITGMTGKTGTFDMYLIKTDENGSMIWSKTFGGYIDEDYNSGYSVQQTTDGGYIIAGITSSYGPGSPNYYDVLLVKTDVSGNMLWSKNFGGSKNDVANSVQQTSDGGYIIAGVADYFGDTSYTYLIKTDTDGNVTGINNILNRNNSVTIYPNPTHGKFIVSNSDKINTLEIYNLLGEKIYSASSFKHQESKEIDLYNQPNGIYFVKIYDGKESYTEKIIIH